MFMNKISMSQTDGTQMQNSLTQALTTPSSNMTKNRKLILCAQLKLPAGRGVGVHTYSLSWQPKHWEGATEHGMWQRYSGFQFRSKFRYRE